MDMRTDPFLGKMIRGYRLEQLLGRGSATAVYRARTEELWQVPELIVTILLVPEHLSAQAKARFEERFTEIAKRLATLRHPFLFPLYGYGQEEGMYYLLAPDMPGETLAHHIQKQKRFTPSEILPIFTPIAMALSYVHQQGFTYQFLQPANILLVNSANTQVTGLGLSQLLCLHTLEDEPTSFSYLKNFAGMFMGAPHYLAPEVVKKGEVNPRSDVYSLGILLYEMLSNQSPFSGDDYLTIAQKHVREPIPSFHDAAPDLPMALELIINRALHRTPEQRFQSPDELVAAYAHVLDERLHGPRFFNVVQAVEKIRALPMPTPTPQLRLAAPQQERQADTAWAPNQLGAAAERRGPEQARSPLEDESGYPAETFSSLLPGQKKDEQMGTMRFVEQDEIPTQKYIAQQPAQKDAFMAQEQPKRQEQAQRSNGPVTAPLNAQDLEKSSMAKRAFASTPAQSAPEMELEEQLPFPVERYQAEPEVASTRVFAQDGEVASPFVPYVEPEPTTRQEPPAEPAPVFEPYADAQLPFEPYAVPEPASRPETWVASDVEFIPTTRLEPLPVFGVSIWPETLPAPENAAKADQNGMQHHVEQAATQSDKPLSSQPAAHDGVREMALQLQQMKERLQAQAHRKVPAES
jgi:Protein kinase domain